MPTLHESVQQSPEDRTMHRHYMSMFLSPECHALAIALHRGIGWPLYGLVAEDTIWHASVRAPDGTFHDARRPLTEEEFSNYHSPMAGSYTVRQVSEEELQAKKPVSEQLIAKARQIAEELWPKLPWK